MSNDIFNITNLDDLPESMQQEISKSGLKGNPLEIYKLFNIKPKLSKVQILVGLYREREIELKKTHVSTVLNSLVKRGFIQKSKDKGFYEKV